MNFHELAERELNDAASYYDSQRSGLGEAFVVEVERTVAAIADNPLACQLRTKKVRRKPLRRFPYSVLYSVNSDGIRILAIAHHKRRPFYWRGRH